MKKIRSNSIKKNLYLVNKDELDNIIDTNQDKKFPSLYVISSNKKFKLEDVNNPKDIKVLVLKNKFTNCLCDFEKPIEKYLEYAEYNLEDPTYVAMEMTLDEYMQVKFKKNVNEEDEEHLNKIEINIGEKVKNKKQYTIENNETLLISEKENRVLLPYTIDELEEYAKRWPVEYPSLESVIKEQYMVPLNTFYEKPAKSRFTETYYLVRKREKKSIIIALIYAVILFTKTNLNPAIIAACKTKQELFEYIKCLKENKLDEFKPFKVVYEDEKKSA